jgi:hypothetical protein
MQEYKVTVDDDGTIRFFKPNTDEYHRLDGPACEWANGDKHWFLNGKTHRVDGPAIEYANGSKRWFLNGKLHREDGPAIEWANGAKFWYLDGEELSEEEWRKRVNPGSCAGKVVEIEGRKYRLEEVE